METIGRTLLALAAGCLVSLVCAGDHEPRCTAEAQECLDMMAQEFQHRGWVGIEMDQDGESGEMYLTRVVPDSPAQRAGLRSGDVLLSLNHVEFCEKNKAKMYEVRKDWTPGKRITYTVLRDGETLEISLKLGEIPDHVLAQWVGRHMLEGHVTVETARK